MRKKLCFLAAITGMIFVGIMGCFMKKEDDRERLLSYMKHKYKEEFSYVESYAGQLGKNYTTILVESREHPERRALARLSEQNGRRCFEDNYLAYLMKEGVEKEIGQLAKECFGECKIAYKIPQFVFPDHFRENMTVQEFLSDPYAMPQFYIYPKGAEGNNKDWEQKLDDFREKNAKKGYKIRGTISFEAAELVFSMDENGAFRYMRWLQDRKEK